MCLLYISAPRVAAASPLPWSQWAAAMVGGLCPKAGVRRVGDSQREVEVASGGSDNTDASGMERAAGSTVAAWQLRWQRA